MLKGNEKNRKLGTSEGNSANRKSTELCKVPILLYVHYLRVNNFRFIRFQKRERDRERTLESNVILKSYKRPPCRAASCIRFTVDARQRYVKRRYH